MKKKLILFIILILPFILNIKAQVRSRYDREMEALEKLSKMKDDENKVRDIIYSYKTYVQNYINQNLQNISSSEYRRISNLENTLWRSIMENRSSYSFASHFYAAAREQLEYYKSTLVRATNEAINKTNESYQSVNGKTDNKRETHFIQSIYNKN